jgi:hypothetical protein
LGHGLPVDLHLGVRDAGSDLGLRHPAQFAPALFHRVLPAAEPNVRHLGPKLLGDAALAADGGDPRIGLLGGRGFRLDKTLEASGSDREESGYDVRVDGRADGSCTCKGFTYHRHQKPCKHLAALQVLIGLGKV